MKRDASSQYYAVLGRISPGYSTMTGRLHTCYAPVRRSPSKVASYLNAAPRLACVKPVASVHPEPGSNSPLYYRIDSFLFLSEYVSRSFLPFFPVHCNSCQRTLPCSELFVHLFSSLAWPLSIVVSRLRMQN